MQQDEPRLLQINNSTLRTASLGGQQQDSISLKAKLQKTQGSHMALIYS
jgi:hypothetical protein